MKVVIQYSRLVRKYFLFLNPRDHSKAIVSSNKREIERIARQHGANEIVHMVRSTTKDLERYGHYDHEEAKQKAREYR